MRPDTGKAAGSAIYATYVLFIQKYDLKEIVIFRTLRYFLPKA